jgi:molybdenum cofactor cytidylyltransferase
VIALVLAAGRGRRMGGPKALLMQPNGIALAWAHALARTDCRSTVIVTRPAVAAVLVKHRPPDLAAKIIESAEPDELGQAGSIRAAVQSFPFDANELILLSPVDCLPASCETVQRLRKGIAGADVARPRVGGRGGHPVLLRGQLLAEYRHSARPLRDLFRGLQRERLHDIPMTESSLLGDFDTPADWGQTPHFVE